VNDRRNDDTLAGVLVPGCCLQHQGGDRSSLSG
jgi:hypothetical protein